jgi:diguanylate cyclase (GGDEF)-like protein/PAS domain S-box-containing protein
MNTPTREPVPRSGTTRWGRFDVWWPPALLSSGLPLFGLGYFLLSMLALSLSQQPGHLAPLWYANGLAVALLVYQPPRQWWVWLLIAALAHLAAHLVLGDGVGMAQGLPHLAVILLGSTLLQRYRLHLEAPDDPARLGWVMLLGVLLPGLLGAALDLLLLPNLGLAETLATGLIRFEGLVLGSVATLPLSLWLLERGGVGLAELFSIDELAVWLLVLVLAVLVPLWLPSPLLYLSVLLMVQALLRGFGSAAVGVWLVSVALGVSMANGAFQPPLTARWEAPLFYLSLLLTLLPPLLLAASVAARRQAMQRLSESEQRYRALYRHTPAMLHSIGPDGRLLSVSELWLKKLGYQEHEVLGRKSVDFLSPDSRRQALEQVLPRFEREGYCDHVPCQWLTRDGDTLDTLLTAILERDGDGNFVRSMAVMEDLTERNALATELAASELFEVTLRLIGDGVITTDAYGYIDLINPVAEAMLGCSRTEAHGQPLAQMLHLFDEHTGERLVDPVQRCLAEQRYVGLQQSVMLRSRDGQDYAIQHTVTPIQSRDDQVLGTVMVFQDVSVTRALSARMSHLAEHDALTDLPNRLLLQDRIAQCCQRGQREATRFAVMMLDLDHFKHINDTYGHTAGDTLLRVVADRLANTLRASDTVCRLGGDEFVILLADLPVGDDAADVAEKILREVARPVELAMAMVDLSVSLGIATFPEDGADPEVLMRHADTAMYRAKRDGRNGYCFFTRAMDDAATQRLALEQDLRTALVNGEFTLHFQPVINVERRQVVGAEALVRWQRPGGGLVAPGRFVPTAEESHLILPLGRWVMRQACEQHLEWRDHGFGLIRMSVNVSPIELEDPQFVSHLTELLGELDMDSSFLEIEITEATLMHEGAGALAVLHQIKSLGVRIAVDDFGAGYSSLSDLKRLPLDTIKIDASFVRPLADSPADREIVRAILTVGQGLGLRVIAEGVESPEQFNALHGLGCVEMQGHLLARAAPAAMWRKLVNAITMPGGLPRPGREE